MPATESLPAALAEATADQPAARLALAAALAAPSHAYLFAGPAGSGKRAAARAFVAELLADGAPDPDSARRRARQDPTPHPDLAWLRPDGAQHLVERVRTEVIEASAYRAFEGNHRAFVIEAADAMAEESQNALLKTLEEPAPGAHLILLSSQPSILLETVRSRCQPIRFSALTPEAVANRLAAEHIGGPGEVEAAARLASGDLERARLLVSPAGRELRAGAETLVRACLASELGDAPWTPMLEAARAAGVEAGRHARAHLDELAAEIEGADDRAARRLRKEAEEAEKRATRRGRTAALDTGLGLIAAWLRDVAAIGDGAADLILTSDRALELRADAEGRDPRRARRAAELVMETRARLRVNVSEELALEAMSFRIEAVVGSG